MFLHEQLVVGAYQVNCHLLVCPETREAVIIDPGDDVEAILEMIPEKAKVVKILLTHAHIDHIGAVNAVRGKTGAPVYLHPEDVPLAVGVRDQAMVLGLPGRAYDPVENTLPLKSQEVVRFGNVELSVLHTPGHSPGSVSFYYSGAPKKVVFAGDTLFAGSIGRTDLWRGDMEVLLEAIQKKILTLPPETIVYPGHGPETTVAYEKKTNPFLRD
ncbi:MAG: MBL fold metallo-hydrolase [Spirochaetia bacterium]|nr:MBL fold metallo-hydrolase [Spirochaetia bacterium]